MRLSSEFFPQCQPRQQSQEIKLASIAFINIELARLLGKRHARRKLRDQFLGALFNQFQSGLLGTRGSGTGAGFPAGPGAGSGG